MPKQYKVEEVQKIKEVFENNEGLIFADHSGMKAQDAVAVRDKLVEIESYLKIVKNTLALIAAKDVFENIDLSGVFSGPTSIIAVQKDMASTAKIIKDFSGDMEALKIKAGILEKRLLDAASIEKIASLPSREVLLTNLVVTMNTPVCRLVNILSGLTGSLVSVLDQVRQKKQTG
ncbi:MAG: 50S ribosomal protein L10 [Actinobacteria bacterium]|nr:50S ribosomal protein L10 [Actinomycetota bacterium]